jgi:succinate dehydrogenase / fumarate reductase iron-sulfur subunit
MKERVVDKKYDPLVWLGEKIGIRNKDNVGREAAPKKKSSPVKRPAGKA